MNSEKIKKLVLAGILIAVAVACSPLSFPIGASKCFPVQHVVNVLAAVILGPFYGVGMAFITSLIRFSLGTGTLLAFPGSMCGALLCGLAYKYFKNLPITYIAEVIGTGVIGGLLAFPIAKFIMGSDKAALFGYIIPFGVSTLGGTIIAGVIICALKRTKILDRLFITHAKERTEH